MKMKVCGLLWTPPLLPEFLSTLEASHWASSEPAPGNHFSHLELAWRVTPGSSSDFRHSQSNPCDKLLKVFLNYNRRNKESHTWSERSRQTLLSSLFSVEDLRALSLPVSFSRRLWSSLSVSSQFHSRRPCTSYRCVQKARPTVRLWLWQGDFVYLKFKREKVDNAVQPYTTIWSRTIGRRYYGWTSCRI